ncbi:MAG: sulfotransferase [Bacteroidia bacterium]|nr:sulfotransferase [Bacteroidia bacterium]
MALSHAALGSGLRNWISMLSENAGDVSLSKSPNLLSITLAISGGIPIRLYEKWSNHSGISQTKIQQPLFILGYYRSGTTFLHYLLGADNRFAFPDTFQVMLPNMFLTGGQSFKSIIRNALPETRPMDNLKMGASLPKEEEFALLNMNGASLAKGYVFPKKLIEYHNRYVLFNQGGNYESEWKSGLDYFLRKVSYAKPGKNLVVKTPANTGRIKQLLELYPDAKFIHIRRNPVHVYYSNLKMLNKIVGMLALTNYSEDDLKNFLLYSYKTVYQNYHRQKQLIPNGNLIEIDYEFFVKQPLTGLEKIYKQLNLPDFEWVKPKLIQELEAYQNYETNSFQTQGSIIDLLKETWSDSFERWGYE